MISHDEAGFMYCEKYDVFQPEPASKGGKR